MQGMLIGGVCINIGMSYTTLLHSIIAIYFTLKVSYYIFCWEIQDPEQRARLLLYSHDHEQP